MRDNLENSHNDSSGLPVSPSMFSCFWFVTTSPKYLYTLVWTFWLFLHFCTTHLLRKALVIVFKAQLNLALIYYNIHRTKFLDLNFLSVKIYFQISSHARIQENTHFIYVSGSHWIAKTSIKLIAFFLQFSKEMDYKQVLLCIDLFKSLFFFLIFLSSTNLCLSVYHLCTYHLPILVLKVGPRALSIAVNCSTTELHSPSHLVYCNWDNF